MKSSCKCSGKSIVFNVDMYSMERLKLSKEWFEGKGMKISGGLIVRRSLRLYIEHLLGLTTRDKQEAEAVEINRARKGVL